LNAASGKLRIVLDTKPLIKLFAAEEGWEAVREILSKVEAGDMEAAISVVTLTEVYYKYLRDGRGDLAKARTDQLRYALYLEKIPMDEEVAVKAGDFKGKYGVPIADAIVAATAYLKGAEVIGDDPDFARMPEIKASSEGKFIARLRGRSR